MRFIDEKPESAGNANRPRQLEQMIHYAEVASCRREFLLGYFRGKSKWHGRPPVRWKNSESVQIETGVESAVRIERAGTPAPPFICGGCDNCLAPRATLGRTLAAQKFLSCVYRIREKSGFAWA